MVGKARTHAGAQARIGVSLMGKARNLAASLMGY